MTTTTSRTEPLLRVENLFHRFASNGPTRRNYIWALRDVSLQVDRGTIVALVGESGSGKSTLARAVVRLVRPASGQLCLNGTDALRSRRRTAPRAYRKQVQMVFQDPFGSLNPAFPVEHFLSRPLALHRGLRGLAAKYAMEKLIDTVGLSPDVLHVFPHQLSGGQRQRIAIARALAGEPDLIVADEPTSMLDVSVRIGILNLLERLRCDRGIGMLYITHDLAAARYVADSVIVMHHGLLVEGGETLTVFDAPAHPYTRRLMAAVPDPDRDPAAKAPPAELPIVAFDSTRVPTSAIAPARNGRRLQLSSDHWVLAED